MAKEEYIRDFNTRKVIGILKTESNGDQVAIDFNTRKVLGYYRAKFDNTTDFYGRVVAKGNSVVSFIYNKNQQK